MSTFRCRCAHIGEGPHPCHGQAYTCRKPATRRLYNPTLPALAGMQMKVQATETWVCDECWAEFMALVKQGEKR